MFFVTPPWIRAELLTSFVFPVRSPSSSRTGASVSTSSSTRRNWVTFQPPLLMALCGAASGGVTAVCRCRPRVLGGTLRSGRHTLAHCWWCVRAAVLSACPSGRPAAWWRPSSLSMTCSCVCGAAPPPRGSACYARPLLNLWCLWHPPTAGRYSPPKTSTTRPVSLTWSPAETWTPAWLPSAPCRTPAPWSPTGRGYIYDL